MKRVAPIVASAILVGGCATSSALHITGNAPQAVLHQPSVQALLGFMPGGVDASKTATISAAAPLVCGGTRPSRVVAKTVVRVPNTPSQLAVVQYAFGSSGAARDFLQEVKNQAGLHPGGCTARSAVGDMTPTALIPLNRWTYDAWAITKMAGVEHKDQYNSLRYVQQDGVVYLIRLDKMFGWVDNSLTDAVENVMNTRPEAALHRGTHSARPSPALGVLGRAEYPGGVVDAEPCPEFLLNGRHYQLMIQEQFLDAKTSGLVAFTSDRKRTATIPWGARVRARVDLFSNQSAFSAAAGATGRTKATPS